MTLFNDIKLMFQNINIRSNCCSTVEECDADSTNSYEYHHHHHHKRDNHKNSKSSNDMETEKSELIKKRSKTI